MGRVAAIRIEAKFASANTKQESSSFFILLKRLGRADEIFKAVSKSELSC